ncbi:MAG: hypothetical protein H0U65_12625 [Rubrobacter sp.]|jgi:hypothetical protein|nr:hypothetical protein [Rubrobacter sp.]
MAKHTENERLKPAEVEAVLRRSAQLNSRRWGRMKQNNPSVSAEVVVQVAAAAGIPEEDVRRAVFEVSSEKAADPMNYHRMLLGPARMRAVREIEYPSRETSEYLEEAMRSEEGMKLRYKSDGASLWDTGDTVGLMRRALDLSGEKPLLKTRSVELLVEEVEKDRCTVDVIADISNQRAEYISLAGILGVTFALLFFLAGVQNGLFLLGVIPALAAPLGGFRLAFMKTSADMRRSLDRLLDAAEKGPPRENTPDRRSRPPGQIQGLKPIPRFVADQKDE